MKNIAKISPIFFGLVCLLSTGLFAQDLPPRGPMSFSMYDTNGDGFVSEEEFYSLRAKRMEKKLLLECQ